jgi:inosine-uridine nucleoside N-ribohydrolase
MLGLALPNGRGAEATRSAAELIGAAVRSAPGRTDLLALGPLTDVAEAFRRDPVLTRRLRGVYVMGGALAAAGNAPGRRSEWNFYVDPAAASIVLRSGAPVTLVPLDATRDVPLDRAFYEALRRTHRTPVARFVLALLTRQRGLIDSGAASFWDPLAAGVLTDGLATFERATLRVATRGAVAGWTWVASGGARARVAVSAPRERFEPLFLTVLNR